MKTCVPSCLMFILRPEFSTTLQPLPCLFLQQLCLYCCHILLVLYSLLFLLLYFNNALYFFVVRSALPQTKNPARYNMDPGKHTPAPSMKAPKVCEEEE